MFIKTRLNKIIFFSAVISLLGAGVLAQENSSLSLVQRFPGQYNNTKFSIYLADPQGIGAAKVNKANGGWILSAGRSCLKEYYSSTVTLLPEDFPLSGSLTDCEGNIYETSIWSPGTFPIAELGNCQDEADCRNYCDVPTNAEPCLNFSEKHELMPQEEIDEARKMINLVAGGKGPGGCQTKDSCESYCNGPDNLKECIIFARDNGLLAPEELQEIDMVLAAIDRGATPPNCRGKAECDEYCSKTENLEECLDFGIAAGFVSAQEAEMIRKTGGKGPGNCQGKDACEAFCNDPSNMEECINFALQYELMPPDEAEEARMALQALKSGAKMPNCRGKDECDVYCGQPENINECMDFAIAAGFMTAEEAEMVKKTGGKGPGGCRGQQECDAFCQDPANEETCFRFGLEHGMVSEEQLSQMQEGINELLRQLEESPAAVVDCLKSKIDSGIIDSIYEDSFILLKSTGETVRGAMESCSQAQHQEAEQNIRTCLALPCSEALGCLQNMGESQGEGGEADGGAQVTGIDAEVQAKVESCIQEMMEQALDSFGG